MNILVAGIHGVGKTYLALNAAPSTGMTHTSASKLIKEERALSTWAEDKRVSDVNENQLALASAVRRHNELGTRLLLDGHFVLLGGDYKFVRLETDVFEALNLDGVILIETELHTVARRIKERDNCQVTIHHLQSFLSAEREQAQMVCAALHIPFSCLQSPSLEDFSEAVANFHPASL